MGTNENLDNGPPEQLREALIEAYREYDANLAKGRFMTCSLSRARIIARDVAIEEHQERLQRKIWYLETRLGLNLAQCGELMQIAAKREV